MFSSAWFTRLFYQYICRRSPPPPPPHTHTHTFFFPSSNFSSSGQWSHARSLRPMSKKRWARDVFVLLPHMPTLLMTSLTQSDGPKMAAPTVVTFFLFFLRLRNVDFFYKTSRSNPVKRLLCVCLRREKETNEPTNQRTPPPPQKKNKAQKTHNNNKHFHR